MLSDDDYALEVAVLNRYFARMLALANQPDFLWNGDATIKQAEIPLNDTFLATLLAPVQNGMLEATRRSTALLRGTQCLVALKRWQLLHAEPPPDLGAIVKETAMPGVPIDPYSGEPLRLGCVAGEPVIYSVGSDGQDEEAQVDWDNAPGHPGDFVFRLGNVR